MMFVISCKTGQTLRVVCLMKVEFVLYHKMKVTDGSGCRIRMCLGYWTVHYLQKQQQTLPPKRKGWGILSQATRINL